MFLQYCLKKIKKFSLIALLIIFFFLALISTNFTLAEYSFSNSNNAEWNKKQEKIYQDKTEKLEKLNKKARTYQKILNIKRNQETTLYKQLQDIDNEIKALQNDISEQKNKIESLNKKIKDLEIRINENEKKISAQKKLLARLVRSYYEYNQHDWYTAVLAKRGVAGFLTNKDRLTQSGDKIKELLGALKSLKNNLINKQKSLENKKKEILEARQKLEEKNLYLASHKQQKKALLYQTQGEEAKYQKLLARVNAEKKQILGDIDELFNANSANISAWKSNLPKPKSSDSASLRWYYSQKDPRWKNQTIGNSNSLMKNYGCAITCVSMVITYHGERITPGSMCKQPIFYWDLIKWPSSWGSVNIDRLPNGKPNIYHGNINWNKIDRELKKKNPVIVYIRAGGKGGHYVVIHHKTKNDKYVVHDPYFGPNIYLDSTMSLLSKLYKVSISKRSIDQMILYK